MCTKKEIVILCIGLALVTQACAQSTESVGPPTPGPQNTSIRATPHYDYLSSSSIFNREKWPKPEAGLSNELAPEQSKEFSTHSSIPPGLHWETGAQHPTLEYKISDQGTIHFHVARRGTTAAAVWSF
jgi:hypothetical protein